MSKLFKLKEWLTVEEAAIHISSVLGEPAAIADLFRFALDGHLTLSVNFINGSKGSLGRYIPRESVEFMFISESFITGAKLDPPLALPMGGAMEVTEDIWVKFDENVVSIDGIWDLTMFGAERLDIEHFYQQLTSGLEVTLVGIDGVFVQRDDIICQLKTDFDDNEFQSGSMAQKKGLENLLATKNKDDEEVKKIWANFTEEREKYLEERAKKRRQENYFPSGGLAEHDFVLVVRTKEVTRFIQSLEDSPVHEKPLTSKERNSLLILIGALCKEVSIDHNKRGVANSLVEMTELLGAPLTDDTIRKILSQIDGAISMRNK